MPDTATFNRAAHVLRRVTEDTPADAALRAELAANRRLRPDERRAVTRAVFAYYRWRQWLDPRESLQNQVAAAVAWQTRFDKNPASIKPEALAERAVPAWLRGEFAPSADYLRQLQREPALWLRTRTGQTAAVARALGDCAAPPAAALLLSFGFRVLGSEPKTQNPKPKAAILAALRYAGSRDLFRTEAFQTGLFEIEDLASQLVGHACAPQPGETWWDACAGEGGKTLHLADLMQNKGLVWATDRSVRRLSLLQRRAARAQVFNYRSAEWDGSARLPTKTKFDGILVDAPCSGVGTWQRNPHARWTTTPNDVRELAAIQRTLLESVAPALKPGGRLLYAVCTLTRSETTDITSAFTAAHPEFEPSPVFVVAGVACREPACRELVEPVEPADPGPRPQLSALPSGLSVPPSLTPSVPHSLRPSLPQSLTPSFPHSPIPSLLSSALVLLPHEFDANGMFLAAWKRR
jgi:16S rRNA (cytosine967-C5)-methyltransferase